MAKIVLTGFEPFGGMDSNPSWAAVQIAAQALNEQGHDVVAVELPVVFDRAIETIPELVEQYSPQVFIATGVAVSAQKVRLETVAAASGTRRIVVQSRIIRSGAVWSPISKLGM